MARFSLSNITNLLLSFITFSNIIFNKQEQYDRITARNHWNAHYDYVIVGGGTAGNVLAAKLSEDSSITVLVLEAGASETVSSNTPGLSDTLLGTIVDWKFVTTPQNKSCLGMNEARCFLSSGRVIGGTSSINRLYYLRGNPDDYNSWQQKLNLKSWSWKDVFPFFIRNENQTDPDRNKNGAYFGVSGPMKLDKNEVYNSILEGFVFSSKLSGYANVDLNTGASSATSILQSTIDGGRRISTSTAFLEPNLRRPNLHIISNSYAMNVVFDGTKAVGVKFYRNWKPNVVYARQEVIISAGTINTAKLLMLSGIGPRAELDRHRIPVIADLPVGQNFHDHVGSNGLHFLVDTPEPLVTKYNLKQYFSTGKGPLSENRYAATVFKSFESMRNPNKHPDDDNDDNDDENQEDLDQEDISAMPIFDIPNLMLLTFENSLLSKEYTAQMLEQRTNLRKEIWNSYYLPMKGKGQFTILPIVLTPKSRGTVRLNSANPLDMPLVDPAYLTDPADIRMMVEAMREALRIVKSSRSFKSFNTQLYSTVVPGCEAYAPKVLLSNQAKSSQPEPTTSPTPSLTSPPPKINVTTTTTTTKLALQNSLNKTKVSGGFFKRFSFFKRIGTQKQETKPRTSRHRILSPTGGISKPINNHNINVPNDRRPNNDSWLDYFGYGKNSPYHSQNQYHKYQLIDGFSSMVIGSEEVFDPFRPNRTKAPQVSTTTKTTTTQAPTTSTTTKSSTTSTTTTAATHKNAVDFTHRNQNPIYYEDSSYWQTPEPEMDTANETFVVDEPTPQINPDQQHPSLETIADQLSYDYLQCMARMLTVPIGDYVGTARMGADGDRRRVVDSQFRVIGIDRLRVIDASVIPEIVTGGIEPVAIMIGERGAEFIKQYRRQPNY